eukprot:g47116.t1
MAFAGPSVAASVNSAISLPGPLAARNVNIFASAWRRMPKEKASATRHGDAFWEEERARNNFGLRMLNKMGWEQGQGLGKDKQGMTKSLRGKKRKEGLGLGAEKVAAGDDFVGAYDMFRDVLHRLNQAKDAGEVIASQSEMQTVEAEEKANLGKEMQSFNAQRHLYNRFQSAKDVSNYSQQHMAEIFGGIAHATVTPSVQESKKAAVMETSQVLAQVQTVTSSVSMQEYFASKLKESTKEVTRFQAASGTGFSLQQQADYFALQKDLAEGRSGRMGLGFGKPSSSSSQSSSATLGQGAGGWSAQDVAYSFKADKAGPTGSVVPPPATTSQPAADGKQQEKEKKRKKKKDKQEKHVHFEAAEEPAKAKKQKKKQKQEGKPAELDVATRGKEQKKENQAGQTAVAALEQEKSKKQKKRKERTESVTEAVRRSPRLLAAHSSVALPASLELGPNTATKPRTQQQQAQQTPATPEPAAAKEELEANAKKKKKKKKQDKLALEAEKASTQKVQEKQANATNEEKEAQKKTKKKKKQDKVSSEAGKEETDRNQPIQATTSPENKEEEKKKKKKKRKEADVQEEAQSQEREQNKKKKKQ